MGGRSAPELAEELDALMGEKLGLSGDGLEAKVRGAGRRLPARIRASALEVVEAARRAPNPRLARQIDRTRLDRAHAEVAAFLGRIDPFDRRLGAVLGVLGSIALGVLAMAALVVTLLVWRGYL